MKKKYTVDGMMCTACSSSVERVVKKIKGVNTAVVNLNAKLLVVDVDDTVSDEQILNAIEKAGFEGSIYKTQVAPKKKSIAVRLIASIVLTIILTYLSMGKMWGIVPPIIYQGKNAIFYIAMLMIITLFVMIINGKFFTSGFKALVKKAPNMDTLVSIGSLSAFLYGVFSFVMIIIGVNNNDNQTISKYLENLYFESSAMILTLVTVGKLLEEKAKNRTGSAVSRLRKLAPSKATVMQDDNEITIDVDNLKIGDVVVIKAGDSIPSDVIVIKGEGEVNEASLTGESLPVVVTVGSEVKSATVLLSGYLLVEVKAVGSQTVFGKIIDYVESAEATKAPIARLADKISGIFVPIVIAISIITLIVWLIISKSIDVSLSYAISVLVISCPCALGLATPVAITVSMGKLASLGILVKDAQTLENVGLIKTAVFDKTGTITQGKMTVVDTFNLTKEQLIAISSIEKMSSHSLGVAVTEYVSGNLPVDNFLSVTGKGVSGVVNGKVYHIGNQNYVQSNVTSDISGDYSQYFDDGKTLLFVAENNVFIGGIVISDVLKDDAITAVSKLNENGVKTVILSGDNAKTTQSITKLVGASEGIGGVLPEAKAKAVNNYKNDGKVAFIGDGVNDSPALTVADVGIAIGGGTDVALTSADVVLMNGSPSKVNELVLIGKATRRTIKQNLFWAFIYNVIMIPVSAGVLSFIGITLTPVIASLCMSLSSLFVVLNALRLKF